LFEFIRRWHRPVIALVFLLLLTPTILYFVFFNWGWTTHSKWAEMGTFFSGMYAPIIGILTASLLLIQLIIMNRQTNIQSQQTEIQKTQLEFQLESRAKAELLNKIEDMQEALKSSIKEIDVNKDNEWIIEKLTGGFKNDASVNSLIDKVLGLDKHKLENQEIISMFRTLLVDVMSRWYSLNDVINRTKYTFDDEKYLDLVLIPSMLFTVTSKIPRTTCIKLDRLSHILEFPNCHLSHFEPFKKAA